MPNHIHLIWQVREAIKPSDLQRDFLKFTPQKIKFDFQEHHPQVLEHFNVNLKDRQYQLWENPPLSIPLWSKDVFLQKLEYIHKNPIEEKWRLAECAQEYYYSSAKFYLLNEDDFGFITHHYFYSTTIFLIAHNGLGICEGRAFEKRQLVYCTNVDSSTNVHFLPSALLLQIPC
jgi:REP element-mobilizing transposase RayT